MRHRVSASSCAALLCVVCLSALGADSTGSPFTMMSPSLDLHLERPMADMPYGKLVPSVVIERYHWLLANRPTNRWFHSENPDDLANEQLARLIERNALAAGDNATACFGRPSSTDAFGAGLRWSLLEGFAVYWQGHGLHEIQRLIGFDEKNQICPPGDPSPICKTMPKPLCN